MNHACAIHHIRLFLALQTDLKVPSGHHVEVRVLSPALTAIIASLTRTTPVERPFGFILVFADDTHAHRRLLNTGYHEKV